MKKLLTLLGLALGAAVAWWAWDKANTAPDVFFAGAITGLLLGVVAGIPAGLLVLAAARRDEERASRRQPAPAPQRPVYMVAAPHSQYSQPGYPAPPAPAGSWYSPGPAAYDLDWNANAPAVLDH